MQSGLENHRRKTSALKRSAIIEAARKNFLAHGYSRAGMAEIARDADVSTATLYKHFSSKESLFFAVVKHISEGARGYDGVFEPGDTARDVLYKLSRIYLSVQFEQEANALMRIVIAEVPGAPQLAREMYEVIGNRRTESLVRAAEEMVKRGLLRPHDCAFGIRLGSGMLKEVFVWPALFDADYQLPPDTDEKIHKCIDAYLTLYGPEK